MHPVAGTTLLRPSCPGKFKQTTRCCYVNLSIKIPRKHRIISGIYVYTTASTRAEDMCLFFFFFFFLFFLFKILFMFCLFVFGGFFAFFVCVCEGGGGGQHVKPYIMHCFYNNIGIGVLLNQAPANNIFCWKRQIYQRIAFLLSFSFYSAYGLISNETEHCSLSRSHADTYIHTYMQTGGLMYVCI